MSMTRTLAALGIAAGLGATLMLTGNAHAQANCEWYATTALKQQQENELRKCGFKGDGWNSDKKLHMSWCNSVSPDKWRAAAQGREAQLKSSCPTK